MKKVLLCWIGTTDLCASQGDDVGQGPIAQAVEQRGFDEVFLISNYLEREDQYPCSRVRRMGKETELDATPII